MLTAFNPFTDYDEKALVTVGERVTRAFIFGVLGGKLPKLLPSKKPPTWKTNLVHVKIRLIPSIKVPTKTAFFR